MRSNIRRSMDRNVQSYHSLEELRADKLIVSRRLRKKVGKLQSDITESFTPDRSFIDSSIPYMKYVGYALTAYKTARTVKKIVDFARRRNWF